MKLQGAWMQAGRSLRLQVCDLVPVFPVIPTVRSSTPRRGDKLHFARGARQNGVVKGIPKRGRRYN